MNADDRPEPDTLRELRFALAESDAETPPPDVRHRLLAGALSARPAGRSSEPVEAVSGAEAFRRAAFRMDRLLGDLEAGEWTRPALRDLDVQGLVGHLTGVELAFARSLQGGDPAAGSDHVTSTQPMALAQAGRPPADTHRDWFGAVSQTLALLDGGAGLPPRVSFYGIDLPLDEIMVVRAFEMWTHEEDIRRATGRALADPDAGRLARMAELAARLLPFGVTQSGGAEPDRSVRLVLTGPGGGTWDVPLGGSAAAAAGHPADALVVVDVAGFCRVVGNRSDAAGSGAVVTGELRVAHSLFAGAAALALD